MKKIIACIACLAIPSPALADAETLISRLAIAQISVRLCKANMKDNLTAMYIGLVMMEKQYDFDDMVEEIARRSIAIEKVIPGTGGAPVFCAMAKNWFKEWEG